MGEIPHRILMMLIRNLFEKRMGMGRCPCVGCRAGEDLFFLSEEEMMNLAFDVQDLFVKAVGMTVKNKEVVSPQLQLGFNTSIGCPNCFLDPQDPGRKIFILTDANIDACVDTWAVIIKRECLF
jgi:hypothetical protein